jgi:hypothetical protein
MHSFSIYIRHHIKVTGIMHPQNPNTHLVVRCLPAVEGLVASVLVGIKLGSALAAHVVLIIHVLGVLLGVLMSTHLFNLIHTLGLSQPLDLRADNGGKGFLGERVVDGLACRVPEVLEGLSLHGAEGKSKHSGCAHTFLALVVLPGLHAGKRGSAGNEFVGKVALVLLVLHPTVSLLGFLYNGISVSGEIRSKISCHGDTRNPGSQRARVSFRARMRDNLDGLGSS